jgi:hypothetical protein
MLMPCEFYYRFGIAFCLHREPLYLALDVREPNQSHIAYYVALPAGDGLADQRADGARIKSPIFSRWRGVTAVLLCIQVVLRRYGICSVALD